jgi:enoyl-CoA hydratase
MSEYRYLLVEDFPDLAVRRILLNRPEKRNAQHRGLLVELDHAFRAAEADDAIRVVILGGVGPLFSAGHDMGSAESIVERTPGPGQHPTMLIDGGTRTAVEQRYLQEWHHFFENTRRWRNLRKITIAQVQGTTFAAGLMLAWACDLIVAADDAKFADVVGTRLGMCGVEYFAHPWELGLRRSKELLLTGESIDADEAYRIGMVNRVVPTAVLEDATLAYAGRIARMPTLAALLIKESVNQTQDNMGFYNSLNAAFSLHQLNHAQWAEVYDDHYAVAKPEDALVSWKTGGDATPAGKNVPAVR